MTELPRHFVNGHPGDQVSVLDRGLRYGDGCFETMAVRNGRLPLWGRHYRRLVDSCERLQIVFNKTKEEIEQELDRLIGDTEQGVLRLTVTRGEDGSEPTRIASLLPARSYPPGYRQQGIAVTLCKTRLPTNPFLAGIKHLNRLTQVMARNEWQDEFVEGLLCDAKGDVVEGTITNVFIVENGKVFTPRLNECGVAGVMRSELIHRLSSLDIKFSEIALDRRRLLAADECFLTNAVIGIWPVRKIDDTSFPVGETTRRLLEDIDTLV